LREADFDTLYREHAPGLFSFLLYRTGNRELAEDVVSEAFEKAIRARRGFDRRKSREKTWLYTIALNSLRDRQRRAQTEERALERVTTGANDSGTEAADDVANRDELRRALEILSAEEHEAIALRFGGDLTIPEIARATGETRTTVEGRVYRALRKLRSAVE
jgi:RNA polymerase sigma-70 factor (ECF subfamily)